MLEFELPKETTDEIPGLEEFMGLLSTPDVIFDAMYSSLMSALEQQVKEESFEQEVKKMKEMAQEDYLELIKSINELLVIIKEEPSIGENKKSFFTLLFKSIIGDDLKENKETKEKQNENNN